MRKQYFKGLKSIKQSCLCVQCIPILANFDIRCSTDHPGATYRVKERGDIPLPGKFGGRSPPPLEKLEAQEKRVGTF